MKKYLLVLLILVPLHAFAGDAATVIFKSGQVVRIDDGFRQLVEAMKKVKPTDEFSLLEMNISGGTFLLNMAQAVVVCRDTCSSLQIMHQLDPRRGQSNYKDEK